MARKNKALALVEARLHRLEEEKRLASATLASIEVTMDELSSIRRELEVSRKVRPTVKNVKVVKAPTPGSLLKGVEAVSNSTTQ